MTSASSFLDHVANGKPLKAAASSKPLQLIDDIVHGRLFRRIGGLQDRHGHAMLCDGYFFTLGDTLQELVS